MHAVHRLANHVVVGILRHCVSWKLYWQILAAYAYILNEVDVLARLMMWPKQFLVRIFLGDVFYKFRKFECIFSPNKVILVDAFHLWRCLDLQMTAARSKRRLRCAEGS